MEHEVTLKNCAPCSKLITKIDGTTTFNHANIKSSII